MASDRTVRVAAVVYAVFFAVVVILGYIPGLNAEHVHQTGMTMAPDEHMLLGRYRISVLDDVTHGLSAILFLVAGLVSARASRLALTAFGWYYAYDATIYLVTGFLQQKGAVDTILLNLPHVVISGIMLFLAYRRPATA
jgi:hypothetical protein